MDWCVTMNTGSEGNCFINQIINMKNGLASKMRKHPNPTPACYASSVAPAGAALVCILIRVQRGGMWWQALSLAGCANPCRACRGERARKLHARPKSQRAREAIGLTGHEMETAQPRRPRALSSGAVGGEWRWFGWLQTSPNGISVARLLVSIHTHNLIFAKHLEIGFAVKCVRAACWRRWFYLARREIAHV